MRYSKLLLLLALVSCSIKNTNTDSSNTLYYSDIGEICPGTVVNLTPSWHGETPTDFEIVSVVFAGEPIVTECFSVEPETGIFHINNSDNLAFGRYSVSIACRFGGERKLFPDAIGIHLMKPVPDGIVVTPSLLEISLSSIVGEGGGRIALRTDWN